MEIKKLTRNPVAIGCLSLFGLLFVLVGVLFYLYFPWRSHILVRGVVLDAKTNQPIPNARVVVELVGFLVFDESFTGYGLVTDKQGRFSLDTRAPKGYTWVWVSASAPNDEWDELRIYGHDVILHTKPLPPSRGAPYMHYEQYRASIVFDNRPDFMIFPGERCNPRHTIRGWPKSTLVIAPPFAMLRFPPACSPLSAIHKARSTVNSKTALKLRSS